MLQCDHAALGGPDGRDSMECILAFRPLFGPTGSDIYVMRFQTFQVEYILVRFASAVLSRLDWFTLYHPLIPAKGHQFLCALLKPRSTPLLAGLPWCCWLSISWTGAS